MDVAEDDLTLYKTKLEQFIESANRRHYCDAPYTYKLAFTYKGREYDLEQSVFLDAGALRYQHYLQRDGRITILSALEKTLSEMSWDLRYPEVKAQA